MGALAVLQEYRGEVPLILVTGTLGEELAVEAQALRAMGDEAGAQRAEAELAGKFPEQAIQH